jgi:hypothetical protein
LCRYRRSTDIGLWPSTVWSGTRGVIAAAAAAVYALP